MRQRQLQLHRFVSDTISEWYTIRSLVSTHTVMRQRQLQLHRFVSDTITEW
jgi:hypothetical protein